MRRKKKSIPKIVKTIPLSVAIAALSTGAAFADVDEGVYVDMGEGKYKLINPSVIKDKNMLKAAFLNGSTSIVVADGESNLVEFGLNAGKAPLNEMWGNANYEFDEDDFELYV